VQSNELIAAALGIFNALRLVSYLPQIVAVARDRHGAVAISLLCWAIWIGANATAGLYARVNVGDLTLALVSAFNAACCMVVFVLAALKRVTRWRRASAPLVLGRRQRMLAGKARA
jgi:hypothetical protein